MKTGVSKAAFLALAFDYHPGLKFHSLTHTIKQTSFLTRWNGNEFISQELRCLVLETPFGFFGFSSHCFPADIATCQSFKLRSRITIVSLSFPIQFLLNKAVPGYFSPILPGLWKNSFPEVPYSCVVLCPSIPAVQASLRFNVNSEYHRIARKP